MLSATEAAALLGVTKPTLYVYVSRGLIQSQRVPGTNRAAYRREDVLRLKHRGALRYGEPVLDTAITELDPRGPIYRGHVAVDLARRGVPYAHVAHLLWRGQLLARPLQVERQTLWGGFRLDGKAPLVPLLEDLLHVISRKVPRFAFANELALAEEVVSMMMALVWSRVTSWNSEAINRALVVVADHELNPSTFAARIAASTGAGLVPCLQAALATFSGPRHGGACDRIEALLDEIGAPERARAVVAERLRRGDEVPGFFGEIYPAEDPRATALLELPAVQTAGAATARALIAAMKELAPAPGPSVDLALVALARGAAEWPQERGPGIASAVFACGRTLGWIAHILEQRQSDVVLRPRARFIGSDVPV